MPASRIENITRALNLINLAIPGITAIVVSLKSGKQVDLQALLDDTNKRVQDIIDKGEDFLARTE